MNTRQKWKKTKLGSILFGMSILIVLITNKSHANLIEETQAAQKNVDHAWEIYHTAALSGTLASPEIQMRIEKDLHLARTKLVEARDARKANQEPLLRKTLNEIESITTRVIRQSQEKKR